MQNLQGTSPLRYDGDSNNIPETDKKEGSITPSMGQVILLAPSPQKPLTISTTALNLTKANTPSRAVRRRLNLFEQVNDTTPAKQSEPAKRSESSQQSVQPLTSETPDVSRRARKQPSQGVNTFRNCIEGAEPSPVETWLPSPNKRTKRENSNSEVHLATSNDSVKSMNTPLPAPFALIPNFPLAPSFNTTPVFRVIPPQGTSEKANIEPLPSPIKKRHLSSFVTRPVAENTGMLWSAARSPHIRDVGLYRVWEYNKFEYEIVELGAGQFHRVYGFADVDSTIELHTSNNEVSNAIKVKTADLVIKIINHATVHPCKRDFYGMAKEERNELEAYQHLKEIGMPVPEWYANFKTFNDPSSKCHGALSIVQRMDPIKHLLEPLTKTTNIADLNGESQRLLNWVTSWIVKHVDAGLRGEKLLHDFRPCNVMLMPRSDEFGMCDFSKPKGTKSGSWLYEDVLYWICEWSGMTNKWNNINRCVFDHLMGQTVGDCTILEHVENIIRHQNSNGNTVTLPFDPRQL